MSIKRLFEDATTRSIIFISTTLLAVGIAWGTISVQVKNNQMEIVRLAAETKERDREFVTRTELYALLQTVDARLQNIEKQQERILDLFLKK